MNIKHVENDGHLNKHFFFFRECCLKKNQNAPRLFEVKLERS